MDYRIIVIPLIGGVIGYITNSIAITMLFRPHNAKYIGKWRIPFTPGIIPKEKERLAKSVADTITENLLNGDVLQDALLAPDMIRRLDLALDGLIERYRTSDRSLREELETLGRNEATGLAVTEMTTHAANLVALQLEGFNQGEEIAQSALYELKSHYSQEGSLKGMLAKVIDDKLVDSLSSQVGVYINRLVSQNGPKLIEGFIQRQAENILDMPVSQVINNYADQIPQFKQSILSAYRELIDSALKPALKSFDLSRVIVDRIGDFSTQEVERLIKSVIDRELKIIIWLGALLGFIIGFANLLFI